MPSALRDRGGSLPTTPWQRREVGGVYVGHNRQVWLYREIPLAPLQHEDPGRRLETGGSLEGLIEEIGSRSRDIGQGVALLSQNRNVHIFAAVFDALNLPPAGTNERLSDFLEEILSPVVSSKAVLLGVQLRSSTLQQVTRTRGGLAQKAKAMVAAASEDLDSGLDAFTDDYNDLDSIFRKYGARDARPAALSQLEAWFNSGLTPDAAIAFEDDQFHVVEGTSYQISAVMGLPTRMTAPLSQWLLDASTHPEPAVAISIRGELEPATVTRNRLRRQRRKLIHQEEEEAATGDIGREENSSILGLAEDMESFVRKTRTPWLTNCSILIAREARDVDESYADMLADKYEITTKPLEHRQLEALHEMQPCSATRVNPFPQDINPAMIAYAGLPAYSVLGDDTGVFLGHVDPDFVPTYVDTFAASKKDQPPVFGVFGDPGSGKTFACQLMAGQAAMSGVNCIFVNPKGFDTLAPWANWVRDQGVPARVVSMSKMEERGGAFDPFGFTNPQMAAEILTRHIQTVLGSALTPKQDFALADGLARGAAAGARCAIDALAFVEDRDIVDLVHMAVRSSTLFALAFSKVPGDMWANTSGLTLIEFDRELPLPKAGKDPSSYEPAERLAVAAMRLVSRASLELLMRARGGVLVIDEAHHYIGSPEGLASLDRLAREGRSMGLLPIFATQRVTDLLAVDMESFMSRVLCMKLNDRAQAVAALTLCRLEPTQARIDFLRTAGPRRGGDGGPARSSLGILRDIYDRHAVISIGPVPEHLRLAMSTNRSDREARDATAAAADSPDTVETTL
jgi:hypothetical protein